MNTKRKESTSIKPYYELLAEFKIALVKSLASHEISKKKAIGIVDSLEFFLQKPQE